MSNYLQSILEAYSFAMELCLSADEYFTAEAKYREQI